MIKNEARNNLKVMGYSATENKKGFLLIEVLIYLALSVTLIRLAMETIVPLTRLDYTRNDNLTELYNALHFLRRDLESAPTDKTAYTIRENYISYHTKNTVIIWYISSEALMRRINYLDRHTHDATTIVRNVNEVIVTPHIINGEHALFTVLLKGKSHTLVDTIARQQRRHAYVDIKENKRA
jgi:hypothetical protein